MTLHTTFEPRGASGILQPIVQVSGVSVRYRALQERVPSLKEYAIRWIKRQIRYQDFWALQDVNLEIYPGEFVAIIGANGAGKSTLLKTIARVLRPTTGRVRVRGRVAPLLELGAGFDNELTGRENIYLNATILGYTRRQIEARLDEVIDFSGLGAFINAPLRTYSTGMYARLGFSVATFERPDILIVDEILGVGDMEFQTKSFQRILDFQRNGTAILLVSHSLNQVEELTSRAIWLERGRIVSTGATIDVVNQYLKRMVDKEMAGVLVEEGEDQSRRWGNRKIEITGLQIGGAEGGEQTIFQTGDRMNLHIDYFAHEPVPSPVFGIAIHRQDGAHITGPNTAQAGITLPVISGKGRITYTVPYLPLLEGYYQLSLAIVDQADTEIFDYHDRIYTFRVVNSYGQLKEKYGLVTLRGEWHYDLPSNA